MNLDALIAAQEDIIRRIDAEFTYSHSDGALDSFEEVLIEAHQVLDGLKQIRISNGTEIYNEE